MYSKHIKLRITNSELHESHHRDCDGWAMEICHVLRREKDNNYRVAKIWTPESKRRHGRPKITRRIVDIERKNLGLTSWNEVEQVAKDSDGWELLLCSLILHSPERRG